MNWVDQRRDSGYDDWQITDMMTNTIFAALHTSSQVCRTVELQFCR
jgi:cytochrome P450 monooxygenase